MSEIINYLRRCADNRVLEASLTPEMCRWLVQMIDHLEAESDKAHQDAISAAVERDELRIQVHIVTSERNELADGMQALRARLERSAEAGELSTEQLPDGLQLAVDLLEGDRDAFVSCHLHPIHGLEPAGAEIAGEYIGAIAAIRAEHAKRVAMQRRIAELEAERDAARAEVDRITEAGRVHIRRAAAFESQRDELKAELERAREVLLEARDAVEGRTAHLYRGDCPSPRNWLDRDPKCQACATLIRIDAAMAEKGE